MDDLVKDDVTEERMKLLGYDNNSLDNTFTTAGGNPLKTKSRNVSERGRSLERKSREVRESSRDRALYRDRSNGLNQSQ